MAEILPPTNCPSCGGSLAWVNQLLYCTSTSCGSRRAKGIEHFAKTLKIKGLGPSAIAKLNCGDVDELYSLTIEEITEALGSSKLAEKLFAELENSKSASLTTLLPAFGIPLIGKTAASKLATVCEHISDITEPSCKLAGLGPKATNNLLSWLETRFSDYEHMPFSFEFDKVKTSNSIKGVVCITGKLKSFKTKAEAEAALKECGYEVKSSVTKQVTILVNESGVESSKTQKARESGITVVNNLYDLIGD